MVDSAMGNPGLIGPADTGVVESISVFRPSITVLRDGSKGFVGGLFFRSWLWMVQDKCGVDC